MSEKHEDYRRMLEDVLQDEGYRTFRQELRRRGIEELRKRRLRPRLVRLGLAVGAAAALVILSLLLAHRTTREQAPAPERTEIVSVPHEPSEPTPIPSEAPAVQDESPREVVQTESVGAEVQIISDAELLAIFKDRPCALVATEGGRKRLLVYDQDQQTWVSGPYPRLSAEASAP